MGRGGEGGRGGEEVIVKVKERETRKSFSEAHGVGEDTSTWDCCGEKEKEKEGELGLCFFVCVCCCVFVCVSLG